MFTMLEMMMKKELLYKTIMIVLMMTSLSGCKAPTDVYETLFKSTMRLINKGQSKT